MKTNSYFYQLSRGFWPFDYSSTTTIARGLATLGVVILLNGCSSNDSRLAGALASATNNVVSTETISAMNFLLELHKQRHLPGDSKNYYGGEITSDKLKLSASGEEAFPISRTFHVAKKGNPSTNHYTVVRQSAESAWELQRAWRTDKKGNIIEEWPVP